MLRPARSLTRPTADRSQPGALQTAHRYIACENVQATITCTQAGTLLLSAGAYVTRYVDVPTTAWYAPYVEYATVNKLMSGIGNRCFSPDTVLTRGMFVTVLGQLAQIDEDAYPGTSFNDVEIGRWYAPFVEWAAQHDVVSGTGNGRFEPNAPITREQMASIVARYVQSTVRRSRRLQTLSCSRTWMRSPAGRLRAWSLCA